MHVGLSRVAWERGDLASAADHLRRADELGDAAGLPQNPYRWRVAMARLREAEGDTATALAPARRGRAGLCRRLLTERPADRGDPGPDARRRREMSPKRSPGRAARPGRRDDLSYLREYEHVTLAQVLLADHDEPSGGRPSWREATALLDRLLAAAEAGGRIGTVIEVLVLQALARGSRRTVRAGPRGRSTRACGWPNLRATCGCSPAWTPA